MDEVQVTKQVFCNFLNISLSREKEGLKKKKNSKKSLTQYKMQCATLQVFPVSASFHPRTEWHYKINLLPFQQTLS